MAQKVDTIQLSIKKPHHDPVAVHLDPSITIKTLKADHGFVNHSIQHKGKSLKNDKTVQFYNLQPGDTLHAFPSNSSASYQQIRRVNKGLVKNPTARHNHEQTQAVVMDEGQRARDTVNNRCDAIESKVDKVLEFHERVPPSNPGDLDLMAKVLNKCRVRRMNQILQDFNVKRPGGVKREGKAALIVKHVPREQLLKLLDAPDGHGERPANSTPSSSSGSQTNMDNFFNKSGQCRCPVKRLQARSRLDA